MTAEMRATRGRGSVARRASAEAATVAADRDDRDRDRSRRIVRQVVIDDATGRALDSNYSGNLYTNPPSGGDNYQNWYFD